MADAGLIASKSLKNLEQELLYHSQNIAASSDPNYEAIKPVYKSEFIEGGPAGARLATLKVNVDSISQDKLYKATSLSSYQGEMAKYYDLMQKSFGRIGEENGFATSISKFFMSINELASNPSAPERRVIALQGTLGVTSDIAEIASSFEKLRYEADLEIGRALKDVNAIISEAYDTNLMVQAAEEGTLDKVTSESKLRGLLKDLSEYFEFRQEQDSSKGLRVRLTDGTDIFSETKFLFGYTPALSVADIVGGAAFNDVYMTDAQYLAEGRQDKIVVFGGQSEEVVHAYRNGKIAALLELRDKTLPQYINQVNNLAFTLKNEVNKIHNMGSGYPPTGLLKGTTFVSRDQILPFDGKVRVAIVDEKGSSIPQIKALTLDLSKLDSGVGQGSPNLQAIMKEIGYHFGERLSSHKSVNIGALNDVKLVMNEKKFDPSTTISFDVELENFSASDISFNINGVTVADAASNVVTSSFSGATVTAVAGDKTRSKSSGITITNPATIDSPYTVNLDVTVTDANGTYNTVVKYLISPGNEDAFNGYMNNRHSVSSVVSGAGVIQAPQLGISALDVVLTDLHDVNIAVDSTDRGFVKLATTNSNYRLAIDSMDSSHKSNLQQGVVGTGDGLAYFLGLNDLLVNSDTNPENWSAFHNAAYFLDVRKDIKLNSNLISGAYLTETSDPLGLGGHTYEYEITSGDQRNLVELASLSNKSTYFQVVEGLNESRVTFADYVGSIIGVHSQMANEIQAKADVEENRRISWDERVKSIKGVDVNTELQRAMFAQNLYVINSSVWGIWNKTQEAMFNVFDRLI